MSGVKQPAGIPDTEPSRTAVWVEFFKRIISREPQYEAVHLISTGVIYLGDSSTDGSWRIVRSGNDLVIQRLESSTWTTKSTISA
jgi:hypothetical protein